MALILVVDDSSFSRKAIIKILESGGFQGVGAGDYEECMEKIKTEGPDVIFLDLLMPVKSGYDVLRKLKDDQSDIPVVVLTADIQETAKKECLELGAKSFLNKPPDTDTLVKAVSEAIQSSMDAK